MWVGGPLCEVTSNDLSQCLRNTRQALMHMRTQNVVILLSIKYYLVMLSYLTKDIL